MTTTIDNEQKTLNVPNLRFPEFEGEWQENYVNEICNEFKSGKAIKSRFNIRCRDISSIWRKWT